MFHYRMPEGEIFVFVQFTLQMGENLANRFTMKATAPCNDGTKFGWSQASRNVGSPSCPYLLLPNVNS